ncbi:hypothetical protein AaE_007761 [Aphanomyces astaci]|uniref:Uncharacterized protein n=1 Tax=Aphanomyces astaci TaxID=112090 RepID=A0A6A5AGM6_APHAT|nr:hypothetical protein AaE_007761 [Aphanomyces astaci]
MLEPPSLAQYEEEEDHGFDRYSVESDDMDIRHTAPEDRLMMHGHEWTAAAAGTGLPRKVSEADTEADIGDIARMSYASTAMFERDSTASSRYSTSFTSHGPVPPVLHQYYHHEKQDLPVRDSYEL